jgi:multidrug efflux pump subunit AcrB
LIFSIGILVDDAIVVVENMVRHFRLPENHGRPMSEVAVEAVAEVGNPTILATFAVIAAVLPMAFVRGLMGPYMRPIPWAHRRPCSSRCWLPSWFRPGLPSGCWPAS